ncbi:hypothetical protein [Agrobacterium tumefaciens]|nr:hypothetical protein [Agrobacterium tumefaciens]
MSASDTMARDVAKISVDAHVRHAISLSVCRLAAPSAPQEGLERL